MIRGFAACRGYVRALEDAVQIVDDASFPLDVKDRQQMLNIVNSCIGTKFTMRFGSLIAASAQPSLLACCSIVCRCAC